MAIYVYMLECSDGSYYVGSTRAGLDQRVAEHNAGKYDGYTKGRRPVKLVFAQEFQQITDAIVAERQIKGWSRAKKEALIRGDYEGVARIVFPSPPALVLRCEAASRSEAGEPRRTTCPANACERKVRSGFILWPRMRIPWAPSLRNASRCPSTCFEARGAIRDRDSGRFTF